MVAFSEEVKQKLIESVELFKPGHANLVVDGKTYAFEANVNHEGKLIEYLEINGHRLKLTIEYDGEVGG